MLRNASLALLAVACTSGSGRVKDEPTEDVADPTDADADTDSDADTDADADADGDADGDADTDTGPTPTDTGPQTYTNGTTTGGGCVAPPIPGGVEVVEDAVVYSTDGTEAWVCKNGTASMGAANGRFWVEQNGSMVISGDNNVIWAQSGADLAVFSSNNTFYLVDPAGLQDEGSGNVVYICDPLTFDTSSAPSPGCQN